VGNAFLPTDFIGKWWANDKAVCPPSIDVLKKEQKILSETEQ
jgi:hypothetical protein